MFVRKRASGNQLIEAYRDENGNPRQRVVCNLGKHDTPEAALEALRAELDGLLEEPRELEAQAARFEAWLSTRYVRGLMKWHDGEVPPLSEALQMAQKAVAYVDYEWGSYNPALEDIAGYALDFVGTDGKDLSDFLWKVRELEEMREEARDARQEVEPKVRTLQERISTLEAVVSK
jgi:chromosome segregation ATPase